MRLFEFDIQIFFGLKFLYPFLIFLYNFQVENNYQYFHHLLKLRIFLHQLILKLIVLYIQIILNYLFCQY